MCCVEGEPPNTLQLLFYMFRPPGSIIKDFNYRISRPIRHTIFPGKCDLNSTCVFCAEGKYYFQTYKYPYPHRVKTTMKMILVAVTMIFSVSMVNKLFYGC